jgi:hypothetical protein
MPSSAVLDACVLYPASVRDLLVRLASAGVYRAYWTRRILDECFSSIAEARPDIAGKLGRTRRLMEEALPDAMVEDDETLAAALVLPDEKDRHVLAAAIRAGARVIVTVNLRDFPPEALAPFDVEAAAQAAGSASNCSSAPRSCSACGTASATGPSRAERSSVG